MSNAVPRTFRDLFSGTSFNGVEIPILQRDYAQGRPSTEDVRIQFLDALYRALTVPEVTAEPLDLDFVYGRVLHELWRINGAARLPGIIDDGCCTQGNEFQWGVRLACDGLGRSA